MTSCRDSFNIDSLDEQAKLVVSCFPSEADTTWIEVTYSIPISHGAYASNWDDYMEVRDAHIIYKVNGVERTIAWKDRIYNRWNEPVTHGRYYVTGPHQPGDHVELQVSAEGYESISAETTIPDAAPIVLKGIAETKVYDSYNEESRNVYQLTATFTDPAATTDYYAVRIRCKHYKAHAIGNLRPEYNDGSYEQHIQWPMVDENYYKDVIDGWADIYDLHLQLDSIYTNPVILTMSEPLLQPLGELDGDFGYDNDYYQNFYIFNDTQINGQTYTLHLNLSRYHDTQSDYNYLPVQYQVQLFHLVPEFYRYVKSINDLDNNELAQGGFSLLSPTYTNVHNGIGIVGGYCMSQSNWLTRE